jgi:hypothetical protein
MKTINTKTQVKTGRGCFDPGLYTKFICAAYIHIIKLNPSANKPRGNY